MSSIFFGRLIRLLVLLVFQVLVFNNIHLFGYATPLVIGYMLVCFHRNASRIHLLWWGFITGFLFDLFSNTVGMASISCTLLAMMQPTLLNMFMPHDVAEDFTPTFRTMGMWKYILYTFVMMLVLHTAFYLLDAFTLAYWPLTLLSDAVGSLATTILIIMIELLVRSNSRSKL